MGADDDIGATPPPHPRTRARASDPPRRRRPLPTPASLRRSLLLLAPLLAGAAAAAGAGAGARAGSGAAAFSFRRDAGAVGGAGRRGVVLAPTTTARTSFGGAVRLFAKKKKLVNGGGGGGFGATKGAIPPKKIMEVASSSSTSIVADDESEDGVGGGGDMEAFFVSHEEWKPLFRSLATVAAGGDESRPPAQHFLFEETTATMTMEDTTGDGSGSSIWDTAEDERPWRRLPSKPTDPASLEHLAAFLDAWQTALLNIPVSELLKEDGNDRTFLEEGRRTIAVTRFHVLPSEDRDATAAATGGEEAASTSLFATCWSELASLSSSDEPDTGSLVLLPDYVGDLDDLRAFALRGLVRPMRWLGGRLHGDVEVTAMERGGCMAVRILYKLSDVPDLKTRGK